MSGGRVDRRIGAVAVTTAACLWGANHVVVRLIHNEVPLAALVFWRWALALVILLPCVVPALIRERYVIRDQAGSLVVTGAFGVGLFSLLLFAAAYETYALEVGLLQATTPIWALLLVRAMGTEPWSWQSTLGVLLALAGTVVIIVRGDPLALAGLELQRGALWAVLAAVLFAWYSIRARQRSPAIGFASFMAVASLAGLLLVAVPAYILSLTSGEPWLMRPNPRLSTGPLLTAIAFVALGPTLVANLLWIVGVARLGAGTAGIFLYLAPVTSVALAILFLGEPLRWFHVAGMLPIALGLVLANYCSPKLDRPAPMRSR